MNLYLCEGLEHFIAADNRGALNLALKDQLAALEWVHDNIHYFGGDKSKVGPVFLCRMQNILQH
jgi:hypothetical protein